MNALALPFWASAAAARSTLASSTSSKKRTREPPPSPSATWETANELIRNGKIGHVAQAQTSYYRNSEVGQWRYYKLTKGMTPKTVDWDMFLGYQFNVEPDVPLGPKVPFDRAVYGQWRCYW